MRNILFNIILSLSLAFALSCKPLDESSSQTKYGFLNDYEAPFLVLIPTGSTIRICGDYKPFVKSALIKWGAAIGKTYNIIEDCANPDVVTYAQGTDYARRECARWNNTTAFADMYGDTSNIVFCMPPSQHDERVVKHEVGHLFGLCDLYEAARFLCADLHGIEEDSIMFSGYQSDELLADDIAGIRALEEKMVKDRKDHTRR